MAVQFFRLTRKINSGRLHWKSKIFQSFCFSTMLTVGFSSPSISAELLVPPNSSILYVLGDMEVSDLPLFGKMTSEYGVTTVAFDSDGGHLEAGIKMGQWIRTNSLDTVILKDRDCASSCAIAFIHGTSRKMESGSRLGLHLPSIELEAEDTGAYCAQIRPAKPEGQVDFLFEPLIGMSSDCIANTYGLAMKDAVFFIELFEKIDIGENVLIDMLKTAPTEMKWYTVEEATAAGLLTK